METKQGSGLGESRNLMSHQYDISFEIDDKGFFNFWKVDQITGKVEKTLAKEETQGLYQY